VVRLVTVYVMMQVLHLEYRSHDVAYTQDEMDQNSIGISVVTIEIVNNI